MEVAPSVVDCAASNAAGQEGAEPGAEQPAASAGMQEACAGTHAGSTPALPPEQKLAASASASAASEDTSMAAAEACSGAAEGDVAGPVPPMAGFDFDAASGLFYRYWSALLCRACGKSMLRCLLLVLAQCNRFIVWWTSLVLHTFVMGCSDMLDAPVRSYSITPPMQAALDGWIELTHSSFTLQL